MHASLENASNNSTSESFPCLPLRRGPTEDIENFTNDRENALTLTACGGTKDLFKLLSWKFCLSTPPSIPPSRSTTSLKKIVCLRIMKIRLYESRIGDTNIVVARGKQIVEFRRDGKVKEQLDMVENPSVREQREENVTYQDDVSFEVAPFLPNFREKSSSIVLSSSLSSLLPHQNDLSPLVPPLLPQNN